MYIRRTIAAAITLALLGACQTAPSPTGFADSYQVDPNTGEGRFFPPVADTEIHATSYGVMVDAGPLQRQFFTDRINMETSSRGQMAPIVVQSTGEKREVLVLMVPGGEQGLTPYIARALLARTTSIIRFAPLVSEMGMSDQLDVYDVAAVLGFKQVVVTDGRDVAYVTKLEVS